MQDRFKFNAVVKCFYYDENDNDIERPLYVKSVDILDDGCIGIFTDRIKKAIEEQLTDIKDFQYSLIFENFADNSSSFDNERYLTIAPEYILQSTGLKDKNGKLIHEGDIVTDGSTVLEIVFEYAEYHFKYVSGAYQYPTFYSNASRFEIIGNIYENPELLEKQL